MTYGVLTTAKPPTLSRESWALLTTVGLALTYATLLPHLGFDTRAAATIGCVAVAAALSGIAGFAFSAICGAMIFHFRNDPVESVQIMLVCSIANQSMGVWALRRDIRLAALKPYLLGGCFGLGVGIWLLLNLSGKRYTIGLGAVLLAYGAYMLFRKPIVLRRAPVLVDVLSGFLGGLLGGFAATPGAPVSVWCGMKGWDRTAQRAVFQPFILIMQIASLALLAVLHAGHGPSIALPPLALACVPAGLAGTWWGLNCFRRLSDDHFRMALNILLIVSGAGLAL